MILTKRQMKLFVGMCEMCDGKILPCNETETMAELIEQLGDCVSDLASISEQIDEVYIRVGLAQFSDAPELRKLREQYLEKYMEKYIILLATFLAVTKDLLTFSED